jgi:selenocysteine lyase/cysteine desulfurase
MGYCYLSPAAQARFTPVNAGWRAGSVPLGNAGPSRLLRGLSGQGIICSARDGNLRLAVHFYNHEDDIERLVTTLASSGRTGS